MKRGFVLPLVVIAVLVFSPVLEIAGLDGQNVSPAFGASSDETATPTPTLMATATAGPTYTATATPTPALTSTPESTPTPTEVATAGPTYTATASPTPAPTRTPRPTRTPTPTRTPPPIPPPPPPPPVPPSTVKAETVSPVCVKVSWHDDSFNESGFVILRWDGSNWQPGFAPANATSYSDCSLPAGRTFCYIVGAYNSFGVSWANALACATTLPEPPPVPPSDVKAQRLFPRCIKVSWRDNSHNEDGFLVQRWDGSSWQQYFAPANATSYTDCAALPGRTYCYVVGSYNRFGVSRANSLTCAPSLVVPPLGGGGGGGGSLPPTVMPMPTPGGGGGGGGGGSLPPTATPTPTPTGIATP